MIPIVRPHFGAEESAAALRAIESGWVSHGPRTAEFERAIAAEVGVAHGRAVNSCTNAILLTLLALGLRPGDEVIVPAFTCVAALNPIELLGGVPVPVDVELTSFGIDPAQLEAAITPRPRGVVFAHLFGLAADVEPVAAVCRARGLWLIEDIALGLGARAGGRAVGSFGDAAVLSFHPRKLLTTGEGGMVVTDSAELADKVAALRNYGASRPAWERHNQRLFDLPTYLVAGLNCKLTDIQGAIGVEQARRLPELIAARCRIAARYLDAFDALGWLSCARPRPGTDASWQSFVLVLGGEQLSGEEAVAARDRLLVHLDEHRIAGVQGAQAMPLIQYYEERYGWPAAAYPRALFADRASLCLPMYPALSEADQDTVIEAVTGFSA
jgi:perosamine synthetase